VLHQGRADAPILHCRIDGDGSQPDDWRTLIDEVAADNIAVEFGNDAVRAGTRASSRQQADRDIGIAERGGDFYAEPMSRRTDTGQDAVLL